MIYKFHFDYDHDLLMHQAKEEGYENFIDPKGGKVFDDWFIKRIDSGYGKKISDMFAETFDCEVRPRFYIQNPGYSLGFHRDRGTQCAINIVLQGEDDKITFRENGVEESISYKVALLNVQKEHAVFEPRNKRYLFKMSIFDKSYQEIKENLSSLSYTSSQG